MANIAIVNYCNLKCPYCFADDMIQEESKTISLENFKEILDFCGRVPFMNHIGIIGGEPTLHPHFDDILKELNKYCKENNTDATVFTNGIELDKHLAYFGERIHLLINCNSPETQGPEKYKKHIETLDHLNLLSWFDKKASCGCNVHMGCEDYSYIWEIVDRYNLTHIRTSVVSPGGQYINWRTEKELYYTKMKPIFLQFCKDAILHNCRLGMDCGHIPMCYFTKEERELVESICDNLYQDVCEPVIDITPNFEATSCFGSYDPVDIRDFSDLVELNRYLLAKKNLVRYEANGYGRCANCKNHELMKCQGGCLGFACMKGIST